MLRLSVPSAKQMESYHEESNIHEDITIHFVLPDGTKKQRTVKTGETIQELKRHLMVDYGLQYKRNNFYFRQNR